ncbi:helix-turn-helix domain-containing protein [uncultured Slackia sp.]|uniref:helix-turn-helix domain-containing protein n=1 Tax=uncultured Slackia sp. TaxID=665903 RepID=UPI002676C093|nr:helix-turn-helix domain-containing protein [uncultured Slackia sp.]
MVDALEIGYAIKDRRAELGMTQAQLAEAAGVSKRCLWSLELGQNPGVQLDKLTAVLGALGLELTVGNPSDEPQAEQLGIGGPAARDDASAGALSILTGGAR